MESAIAGRRRTATRHSAEDQALDQIAKEQKAIKVKVSLSQKEIKRKEQEAKSIS